jgi:hypothetical protein
MFYQATNISKFSKVFFDAFLYVGLILFLGLFYGFVIEAKGLSVISAMLFILVTSLCTLSNNFRKSPISYVLCIFTFMYLNIPIFFYIINKSYEFGIGIGSDLLPFIQSEYHEIFPIAIMNLLVLWVSLWLGIVSTSKYKSKFNVNQYQNIKLIYVVALGLLVAFLYYLNNLQIKLVYSSDLIYVSSSLMNFIFYDDAYLMLAGLILIFKFNENISQSSVNKISFSVFFLFIIFIVVLSSNAGSKAAFIIIITIFYIFPISILGQGNYVKFAAPSNLVIVFLTASIVPIFFLVSLQRELAQSSVSTVEALYIVDLISQFNLQNALISINNIFYRLAAGGFESYIFIYKSFSSFLPDLPYTFSYFDYVYKSFLNLVLMGTPYQEAFSPSSMFLPEFLHKEPFGNNISNTNDLIRSFNTKPFTIFGLSISIFGVLIAPLILYIFGFLSNTIFLYANSNLIKLALLYFIDSLFGSFGLELALANSIHLFVSMYTMLIILKLLSNFKLYATKLSFSK